MMWVAITCTSHMLLKMQGIQSFHKHCHLFQASCYSHGGGYTTKFTTYSHTTILQQVMFPYTIFGLQGLLIAQERQRRFLPTILADVPAGSSARGVKFTSLCSIYFFHSFYCPLCSFLCLLCSIFFFLLLFLGIWIGL